MSVDPKIQGDPLVALIGQLNRFRARDARFAFGVLRKDPLPLETPLTFAVASEAVERLVERLDVSAFEQADPGINQARKELQQVQAASTQRVYVTDNLQRVVQTLAIYGDSLGLPPATVGITGNAWDALTWAGAISLTLLASFTAAFAALRSRRRSA